MASRLRSFFSVWLPLALLGTLAGVWHFFSAQQAPQKAHIRFEWQSAVPARVQIYYDSGQGIHEGESVAVQLPGLPDYQAVTFELPAMYLGHLRFDPTDQDQPASVRRMTLSASPHGDTVDLTRLDWTPNDQVQLVEKRPGELIVTPRSGVNDPHLVFTFSPRFATFIKDSQLPGRLLPGAVLFGTTIAALAGILVFAFRIRHLLRNRAAAHPWITLSFCAALSTALALYPLWIDGRSLVSPHIGAAMLYGGPPYVGASTSDEVNASYGADVGALMWAHLPSSQVLGQSMQAGEWPLWQRYTGCGTPLLGQGQTMFGDPLQLAVIAADGAPWAWDLKFGLTRFFFALALAGSSWLLWHRLGGAALVALGAPFIAFFNFRFNHPATFSHGYAPLILLSWLWVAKATTRQGLIGGLLAVFASTWMVACSGTVKEAYLSIVFFTTIGVTGAYLEPSLDQNLKKFRRWASLLTPLLLIGVTSPLWATFLANQAISFSVYDAPRAHLIPRGLLLGLFDDLFTRVSSDSNTVYTPAGNGLLWFGVLAAFIHARRAPSRIWFIGLSVAAALCVAMAFSFVPKAWILAVPYLNQVTHIGGIFSSLALVPLWLLAGWGFAETLSRAPLTRWKTVVLPLSLTALAIAMALATLADRETRPLAELLVERAFFWPNALTWIAGLGLLWGLVAAHKSRAVGPTGVVIAGVAVTLLLFRHGLHIPSARTLWPTLSVPGPRVALDQPTASVRWVQERQSEPSRLLGTDNDLIPGVSSLYGLEGMNGPEALMVRNYRELLIAAQAVPSHDWRVVWTAESLVRLRSLLDLFGVRYILSRSSSLPAEARAELRAPLDLNVFERTSAWPRAFFTSQLHRYDGVDDFLQQLRSAEPGPRAWMEAKDALPFSPSPASPVAPVAVPATNYSLTPNTTRFTVQASGPGLAVLQETLQPGLFMARLNGEGVPVLRINHAFKGVSLPHAGEFTVEFSAVSPLLNRTLAVSGLSTALFVLLLFTIGRRSRPPTQTTS